LTLGIGERLFGTTMWFGGTTATMRKAPNGDVWFTNGAGLARIVPGGAPQQVIALPFRVDPALTLNSISLFDVNADGAILLYGGSSAGDNRIFLYQNGQAKQLLVLSATATTASTVEGRIAQSVDSFALDGGGRVIGQLRFRGLAVPTLGACDGSAWKTAAIPNEAIIAGRLATNLPNCPRSNGEPLIPSS